MSWGTGLSWASSQYLSTGVKQGIQLVELEPGKGTFMNGIIRVRWPLFVLLTPRAE